MEPIKVVSVLQHVKNEDNEYVVTLNYNTVDEVLESLESGKTLRQINTELKDTQEGLLDDLATVIHSLAGLLDNRLDLNQIYRENFKDLNNINLTAGQFEQGCIKCLSSQSIDFSLKNPKELRCEPKKFKLSHMIKFAGNPRVTVDITFNALDAEPLWFNANEAILNGSFFEIPDIAKDEGKPYAMNIRFHGICDNASTIEISDLMVLIV